MSCHPAHSPLPLRRPPLPPSPPSRRPRVIRNPNRLAETVPPRVFWPVLPPARRPTAVLVWMRGRECMHAHRLRQVMSLRHIHACACAGSRARASAGAQNVFRSRTSSSRRRLTRRMTLLPPPPVRAGLSCMDVEGLCRAAGLAEVSRRLATHPLPEHSPCGSVDGAG